MQKRFSLNLRSLNFFSHFVRIQSLGMTEIPLGMDVIISGDI